MPKITNETALKIKEYRIISMMKDKNDAVIRTFNRVKTYFETLDLMKFTSYCRVINAVYILRSTMPNWKLANECGISESTLFRNRHEIADCFFACYEYECSSLNKVVNEIIN